MSDRGQETKEVILAAAENLILKKGFTGTSIDDIIKNSFITKSGFFYHFKGKADLAQKLLERFIKIDNNLTDHLYNKAKELSEDPLQRMLIFLKLYKEMLQDLPSTHPGCIIATYCYESEQFNDEVRALNKGTILSWRNRFSNLFDVIIENYSPRINIQSSELADMANALLEGSIILTKALSEKDLMPKQIEHFRNYIRLLFDPNVLHFS
jgi:AcrR family transcriptional regulator